MERVFSSRLFTPVFVLAMATAVVIAYSNTFTVPFQFDDLPVIQDSPELKDLRNLPRVLTYTRGVTLATFAINHAIGGVDVLGYHIFNTAIHIINSVLVYFLLLRTFMYVKGDEATGRRLSAFIALLFALHPVQTQSVTYIVQRMESLSSLFYLLSILLLIKASGASTAVKRGALYGGVGLSYLLAFYSKETAYTLPAALALYDFFFIAKGKISGLLKRWPAYAVLAVLFAAFTVTTIMPLGGFGDLSEESAAEQSFAAPKVKAGLAEGTRQFDYTAGFKISAFSPKEYLFSQFNVMVYYLTLLIVPVNQNLDYDFPVARTLFKAPEAPAGAVLNIPMLPPIVSLAILLAIVALAIYLFLRTRKETGSYGRIVSYFIFWFFIILAPTSSFVPIADLIYEHRVYMASLGFFTALVIAIEGASSLLFAGKGMSNKAPEKP